MELSSSQLRLLTLNSTTLSSQLRAMKKDLRTTITLIYLKFDKADLLTPVGTRNQQQPRIKI